MRREPRALEQGTFDTLVIGAGIHGAWIALRAARAGLRVALVERRDFGSGASANSLRILHGGLRYLQHLDLPRMRRSIAARRAFARESPHLVQPLACLLPLHGAGVRSPWLLGPALFANDVVAWDRNAGVVPTARLPRGRLLGRAESRRRLAALVDVRPSAGALWWDAVTTDSARLALEPVLAAAESGAVVANRVSVDALRTTGRRVCGAHAMDGVSGRSLEIRAHTVVDATGPGAGRAAVAAGLPAPYRPLRWVGGLNLVVGRPLALECAVALGAATRRADGSARVRRAGRELFFLPYGGITLVGTDYLAVGADDADPPLPSHLVERFLDEVGGVAPKARLTAADVVSTHWGLLPAEDRAPEVPRKSPVLAAGRAECGAAGLVVAIGEKLTSAPELSTRVLDRVRRELAGARRGGEPPRDDAATGRCGAAEAVETGTGVVASDFEARLRARYGARWRQVARLAEPSPELRHPLAPGFAVTRAEAVHAIREEMALGLDDLVLRRLGLGEGGHPGLAVLEACADVAAGESGWDAATRRAAITALDQAFEVARRGSGAR